MIENRMANIENINQNLTRTTTTFEHLSTEIAMSIFDYLTPIEILVAFFNLNERFRLITSHYLQTGCRLTQFHLNQTNHFLYQRFCCDILPYLQSIITTFQLGSSHYYGQIETFTHHPLERLDTLTLRLIDSKIIIELLERFLAGNRLRWFDSIHLIMDEETQGWNEQIPFCVQNIPVRELIITGNVPYVFAQQSMTGCYSITHITIHLKYDHDLLPLLYYLPNLIECNALVDDRGRDILKDLALLEVLPCLKRFKYEGLMPPPYLHRLILKINDHIEELSITTQDYQWPFHLCGFSSDFFHLLPALRKFHFYIRLISSDISKNLTSYLADTRYLVRQQYCVNIACVLSKDIGQIFSIPFPSNHFEIFEQDFFNRIQFSETINDAKENNYWNTIVHLTLHINIYNSKLLKLVEQNFVNLRTIVYHVPHFSLIPQDHELHQYDVQLRKTEKLIIRESVKHGCHVPQPLLLLTPNLVELDIDHFYIMQILTIGSQRTQSHLFSIFLQLRRLTVRQYDERVSTHFFSYFSNIQILALIFTTLKMQIYRSKLPFLDSLLSSMPKLISLKFEHIKKPQDHFAYVNLQKSTESRLSEYYGETIHWCKWYDDNTQKYNRYATFLCSI